MAHTVAHKEKSPSDDSEGQFLLILCGFLKGLPATGVGD